jgi:3-deoxy-D-manno-octulosonic-acid transferase
LPYDMPGAVRRFLQCIHPQAAIVMETELWPNLFRECALRELPVVLASARLSEKSVARYRRFGRLFRDVFTDNVVVAAQTTDDAARFLAIGANPERTRVIGNVKFDIDVGPDVLDEGSALRGSYLGARPVWTAGSTHAGEEEQVLDAREELSKQHPDALLVLVPRHPNRFEGVAALLTRRGLRFLRRRAGGRVEPDMQVLLVDTVGELLAFYAGADAAFVGGSLVPIGGHNLLEPAALGLPVLTGPSDFNGREIAARLTRAGGALRVADAHELAVRLDELLRDTALRRRIGASARATVEANRGSVARLLDLIGAAAATRNP